MSDFDPYYVWLGISPAEQPPNHYRLLGVRLFEANGDVIAHAADRQTSYLRQVQAGPHQAESQRLLNEIAAARICLLSPEAKAKYDAALKASAAAAKTTARARSTSAGASVPRRTAATAASTDGEQTPVLIAEGGQRKEMVRNARGRPKKLPYAVVGTFVFVAALATAWLLLRGAPPGQNDASLVDNPSETNPKRAIPDDAAPPADRKPPQPDPSNVAPGTSPPVQTPAPSSGAPANDPFGDERPLGSVDVAKPPEPPGVPAAPDVPDTPDPPKPASSPEEQIAALRVARDGALAQGDLAAAITAGEKLARLEGGDPLSARLELWESFGKANAGGAGVYAEQGLSLTSELVAAERAGDALRVIAASLRAARESMNDALIVQVTLKVIEVQELHASGKRGDDP